MSLGKRGPPSRLSGNEEGEFGRGVLSGVVYGDICVLAGGTDDTGIFFSVALYGGAGGGLDATF
jgi:hypothetical protein